MFFRVRGRRAHTSTYVTEPETRRKGARCALMFGLAPPRGFAPLAHPLPYLAQLRLGILVPSDFPLAALSRPGGSMTHCVIDYSARSNPHILYIKTNKKTRIMRVFFKQTKPNRRVADCVLSSARATGAYIDVCNRARDTKKGRKMRPYVRFGTPKGIRTPDTGVRGQRPNH